MVVLIPYLIAAVLGLLVGAGAQQLRIQNMENDALKAEATYREEVSRIEKEWRTKGEEADAKWQTRNTELLDALDDAAGERDSLRDALRGFKSKHSCPPSPGASKSLEDPIGVLANLYERADKRAEVYARTADERGSAGQLCEDRYDALRQGVMHKNPPTP